MTNINKNHNSVGQLI